MNDIINNNDTEMSEEMYAKAFKEEVETTKTETNEVLETPVVKKKAPKKADRLPEDLHNVEPHRMSPAETKSYIKFMREQLSCETARANGLAQNAEQAYEQSRVIDDAYNKLRHSANTKINYLINAINHLKTSVDLLTKEGK